MSKTICIRLLSAVIALMVCMTFVPVLGDVYAEEEINEDAVTEEIEEPETDESKTFETETLETETIETEEAVDQTEAEVPEDVPEVTEKPMLKKGASAQKGYGITCKVDNNSTAGKTRVQATAGSGDVIYGIFVDNANNLVYNIASSPKTKIDYTINMSQFGEGYHSIFIWTKKSTANEVPAFVQTDIPTFTEQPTYKGSFKVYSKTMNIYPYTITYANAYYPLYLEYSMDGGKSWQRSGYMKRNDIKLGLEQGFTIGGLKPNTTYKTRIRYGLSAKKSNGSSGVIYGPALYTGTYKTGQAKKPAIKSVKVKAVKKKFHKHKVAGHYEWTGYHYVWIGPYTEKYWTCKIKVTVKLKKKPNAKGLWINGKFVKGNKKKYTATFTPYPNYFSKKPPKKMKKYSVSIRSYQSKSYGGYSPVNKKKKKVK